MMFVYFFNRLKNFRINIFEDVACFCKFVKDVFVRIAEEFPKDLDLQENL